MRAGAGEGGRPAAPVPSAGLSGLQLPGPRGNISPGRVGSCLDPPGPLHGAWSTQLRDLQSSLVTSVLHDFCDSHLPPSNVMSSASPFQLQ